MLATSLFLTLLGVRLAALERAQPSVVAAAEASRDFLEAHPNAKIELPWSECPGFCAELQGRAGGLKQIGYAPNTMPHALVLYAVRSWEEAGSRAAFMIDGWKSQGKRVIVIASAKGRPAGVAPDFFLDNGAADGSAAHGSVNAMVNASLGWMWTLEYAAAFSRHGLFPAAWLSVGSPESWVLMTSNRSPDDAPRFYDCPVKIAPGRLADEYRRKLAARLAALGDPAVTEGVRAMAAKLADRVADGRRIGLTGIGHLITFEVKRDLTFGFSNFHMFTFPEAIFPALAQGDAAVVIAYSGMATAWADYAKPFRDAGLELFVSHNHAVADEPTDAFAAFVKVPWQCPDAEVDVPVKPGKMAPMSEYDRVVVARMLDAELSAELKRRGISPNAALREPSEPERLEDLRWNLPVPHAAPFEETLFPPLPRDEGAFHGFRRWCRKEYGVHVCASNRWGLADAAGRVRIPVVWDTLARLSDDLFIVQRGAKFGLVDGSGRLVREPFLDMIQEAGDYASIADGGKFGTMDAKTGRILTPPRYDSYVSWQGEGRVSASLGGREGLFTLDGRTLLEPVFEKIVAVDGDRAIVQKGGRMRAWSLGAAPRPVTAEYDHVAFVPGGATYLVRNGRLRGECRADGTVLAPPRYDCYTRRPGGEALARRQGVWHFVDADGRERPFPFACTYAAFAERIDGTPDAGSSAARLYRVVRNGRWGMVDATGRVVLPLDNDFIAPYSVKDRCHYVKRGGTWGTASAGVATRFNGER